MTEIWLLIIAMLQIAACLLILLYIRQTKAFLFSRLEHQRLRAWHSASLLSVIDKQVPPLPFMDGWVAAPDFVAESVREVRTNPPELVVELGSGVSTIFLASAIRDNGRGYLVSFDHDEAFADQTRRLLRASGLDRWAEVRHAPLVFEDGETWYAKGSFSDLNKIGVLIVDGPPAADQPLIRQGAGKVLGQRMAVGSRILLDDSEREGERAIVKNWLREYPTWRAEYFNLERGCFRIVVSEAAEPGQVSTSAL